MEKGVYMTQKELNRVEVLIKISKKQLTQNQAATELGLCLRQVQRLYRVYKTQGIAALASKKRGKPSNNKLSKGITKKVAEIIREPIYYEFRPTFMSEKLREDYKIDISRESVRQIMIQSGIWIPRKQKRPVIYQQRKRRARSGELLQIDGSPHAWFEDRGEPCNLLVFIDDATGRTYGKFFKSETTEAYMITTEAYIRKYGKPLAMYSDKHVIFRVNKPEGLRKEKPTQFARALQELDIQLIYANSP